jgi:dihydroorotase
MSVIGLSTENRLAPGARAEFTVFDLVDGDLRIADSMGAEAHLKQLITPRWTILGREPIRASSYEPGRRSALAADACPHCGWTRAR